MLSPMLPHSYIWHLPFSRLIRLTSPNLSYIIGVGAILLYVDVYLTVVPTEDKDGVTVLCNVR